MHRGFVLIKATLLIVMSVVAPSLMQAQDAKGQGGAGAPAATPAPPSPKRDWSVEVKSEGSQTFLTLHASDAPLADIAAELSKQLKAPVKLSHFMQSRRVTFDFDDILLETALLAIGPQSWADYEYSGSGEPPKLIAVYLQAYNDQPPPVDLTGTNSVRVFEGNTEDGIETPSSKASAEPPLSVTYKDNLLNVRAKGQLLISVLSEIAGRIGCNLHVDGVSEETVDLSFRDVKLEDAPRLISTSVRFRMRTELATQYKIPLLIVLDSRQRKNAQPDSPAPN